MLKAGFVGLICVGLFLPPLFSREAEEESREPVQDDAPMSVDWENPEKTLRTILDKLLAASGFAENVELVYFKDYRFVDKFEGSNDNGVLAAFYSQQNRLNKTGLPVIAVGFAIFEAARSPDELAWLLGHEVIHLAANHPQRFLDFRMEELERWYNTKDKFFVDQLEIAQAVALFETERRNQLKNFKRKLELEADRESFNLISLAGFSPKIEKTALRHLDDLAEALDIGAFDLKEGLPLGKKSKRLQPRHSSKKKN